ncbi:MAG: SDR family oxidoreductase [Cryomorphaceae bacterium]
MKNAIITGSTKGVGRAVAEELSAKGYSVWLTARNEQDLASAKSEIESSTGNAVHVHAVDFSNKEEVATYAEIILDACKTIDVLVNNVGIYIPDELTDEAPKLELQMAVNFTAPYTLTQALLSRIQSQGRGNIFNVCSIVNRRPRVDGASYTISKFAFWGYHQLLHKTLLPSGIKVTGFFPSSIATSSWDGMDAPFDEFIQPDDIASLVANILEMKRGTVPSEIDLVAINPDF